MKRTVVDILWDTWCCISIIGIWPRFIEPKLIGTTHLSLPIKNLPKGLEGLKIVQFTDLHISPETSDAFLDRLRKKITQLKPDILLFTGDFICYSSMDEKERLQRFLNSLNATYGCYGIYGNHDYEQFVSVNDEGEYKVIAKSPPAVIKGLKRLFGGAAHKKRKAPSLQHIPPHPELSSLLAKTPFKMLHNECLTLALPGGKLNLCGVGEYMLGHCLPQQAFKNYDPSIPGIVMAHNPDCVPSLLSQPGEIILCGHTHGGQINIPGVREKFILIENQKYGRGLQKHDNKTIYTNRGVGGVMTFRWGSLPELLCLTLERGHES